LFLGGTHRTFVLFFLSIYGAGFSSLTKHCVLMCVCVLAREMDRGHGFAFVSFSLNYSYHFGGVVVINIGGLLENPLVSLVYGAACKGNFHSL